jgi:phosphomannomutase
MIPWLLVAELLSIKNKSLSTLVEERIAAYPCSGEINFTVSDKDVVIKEIKDHLSPLNPQIDLTDGMSFEFEKWRLNVRASNTEPLLRLNIETKADIELLKQKVAEISSIIDAFST